MNKLMRVLTLSESLISLSLISLMLFVGATLSPASAQTAATGALGGVVTDPAGARIPNAQIVVTSQSTGEVRRVATGAEGSYRVPLLLPGAYDVSAEKTGFRTARSTGITISVTETAVFNLQLEIGSGTEQVTISAEQDLVQTDSSALGQAVDQRAVTGLPLQTRNYTQIIALSPGTVAAVSNATELGRGSGGIGLQAGGLHVHGALNEDNNFEMNGIGVNDMHQAGAESSGIPIPNPDTIQEFKVQTGLYDAAFGRNAGANVELVTKSGTNSYHGSLFEFFRNKDLNANSFFFNLAGHARSTLSQNQYGGTIGGPIVKDKLLFFGSYQGTRQINAASAVTNGLVGQVCASTTYLPPLTTDRSAPAIGALFAGLRGTYQTSLGNLGPAVAADGSNINPVALELLQLKLPDGSYYVPNPQVVSSSGAVALRGFSVFANPCTFDENQYMVNLDYLQTANSRIVVRYFSATSNQNVTFPSAGISSSSILPGSTEKEPQQFYNASIAHTLTLTPTLVNEFRIGFNRSFSSLAQTNPYTYSSIGVSAPPQYNDLPDIIISGCCQLGGALDKTIAENTFTVNDSVAYTKGRHNFRFGGGLTRGQDNIVNYRYQGIQEYLSWPDFLLGLNGAQNGTPFSNVFLTVDFAGLPDRAWRAWSGFGFAQDDFKVSRRLTLNLGIRYERYGDLADTLGRNANFYPSLANPNPPSSGSLQGYVVSSNYSGTVPSGVTQLHNNFGINGDGQNRFGPRVGFAWQALPSSSRVVIRGGYGIYYSTPVGETLFEAAIAELPFSQLQICAAGCAINATARNPFPQPLLSSSNFPVYIPYSPTTSQTLIAIAPDYRSGITQQYSLGVQTQIAANCVLDIGYVGTHGTHDPLTVGLNEPLLASAANPVRGQTTTTFANIGQRVPYLGLSAGNNGIEQVQSNGSLKYNGLEVSLKKRVSKGLELLGSYTFSKILSTAGTSPDGAAIAGTPFGNQQYLPYGIAGFSRASRFVLSFVYQLPTAARLQAPLRHLLGGWNISGVLTAQTGDHLTLTNSNPNNAFAVTSDVIEVAPGCTYGQLVNPGSTENKLTNYFNRSCIGSYPVIGADGKATGFGDEGIGVIVGPGQRNFDVSLSKSISLREHVGLDIRSDFFNALNTPQFADPVGSASTSTFGIISGTTVNPRIIQLSAKLRF